MLIIFLFSIFFNSFQQSVKPQYLRNLSEKEIAAIRSNWHDYIPDSISFYGVTLPSYTLEEVKNMYSHSINRSYHYCGLDTLSYEVSNNVGNLLNIGSYDILEVLNSEKQNKKRHKDFSKYFESVGQSSLSESRYEIRLEIITDKQDLDKSGWIQTYAYYFRDKKLKKDFKFIVAENYSLLELLKSMSN